MLFTTINLNTTDLTNCLLKSIQKQCIDFDIHFLVVDISNKDHIFSLDNSIQRKTEIHSPLTDKYWNIEEIIDKYGGKYKSENSQKYADLKIKHGSMRHAAMIQKIIDFVDEEFILFDSDVIIKKNLDFLHDRQKYITIGHEIKYQNGKINRISPVVQYFNVQKIRENDIKFFDGRIEHSKNEDDRFFDTGASFLMEIKDRKIPYKDVSITQYANHLGNTSWSKDKEQYINQFLIDNKQYYL